MTQTLVGHTARTSAAPAAIAGLAALALALYQVATPGSPTASYDSVSDWLREALTLIYLLGTVAAFQVARHTGLASRAPTGLVSAGYGLIALGVAAGMVLRDDPDWFFLLAGPGLLASTVGWVWFAVSGLRRGVLPRWAALLAGVGGVLALLFAELGTSVLVGAFWLWVAWSALGADRQPR